MCHSHQALKWNIEYSTFLAQDNCGHYTFTVPSNIAPGDYLVRAEVIGELRLRRTSIDPAESFLALHVASQPGGAQ